MRDSNLGYSVQWPAPRELSASSLLSKNDLISIQFILRLNKPILLRYILQLREKLNFLSKSYILVMEKLTQKHVGAGRLQLVAMIQ